ncbi:hypothetical protein Tco_0273835 [Tanacetum coccineum]
MVGRGYGDDVDGDVVEMTTMVVMLSSDDGCGVVVAVMGGSWKWRWDDGSHDGHVMMMMLMSWVWWWFAGGG